MSTLLAGLFQAIMNGIDYFSRATGGFSTQPEAPDIPQTGKKKREK